MNDTLPVTDLTWIPIAGIVSLVVLLALGLVVVWRNESQGLSRKILRTVSTTVWTALFVIIEVALILFANDGAITGSVPLFGMAAASSALAGITAITAKTRSFTKEPRRNAPSITSLDKTDQDIDPSSKATNIMKKAFRIIVCWLIPFFAIAPITLICFVCLELPSNPHFLSIDDIYLTSELTIIAGFVAGCWLIFQRKPIGFAIPIIVSFVYGMCEFFVEAFKAAAIMPGDLRSMGTGLNVAGGYDYELTSGILFCLVLATIIIAAVMLIRDPLAHFLAKNTVRTTNTDSEVQDDVLAKQARRKESFLYLGKNAIALVISVLLGAYVIWAPVDQALKVDWEEEGVVFDYWQTQNSIDDFGIIPSFIAALQLEQLEPPAGYTTERAEKLQAGMAGLYDQYVASAPERAAAEEQFDQTKPNVILIMNESFADLSSLGGLGVGYSGPEYLHAMDAIAKGKTSVSVYGGGTCNSEFESLTSISLGYVAGGIDPYAIYDLSNIDTIPKEFKALGYRTTAIHPEDPNNWGRNQVYPAIGIDTFISHDSFTDAETSRGHTTDKATYEMVIEQLKSSDDPQFIFDLTMQGHGGYETGLIPEEDNFGYDFNGIVDENAGAATNEYLSSVRLSDQDLEYLITELEQLDEPVVVAFFGDHHPGFSWWFQERFADTSTEIAAQEAMYQTDYFIWANYDIAGTGWNGNKTESTYTGSMAPASLMSWTMSLIGVPLTDYQKADYVSRWWIESNNLFGYLDTASEEWLPVSEAQAVAAQDDIYEQGMALIQATAELGHIPEPGELLKAMPVSSSNGETTDKNKGANEQAAADEGDETIAPEKGTVAYQDAVMDNVMRWLAHLNFSERLR